MLIHYTYHAGRPLHPAEVIRDSQVRHNELITTFIDERFGAYSVVRPPVRFGGNIDSGERMSHAPLFGEHTDQIRSILIGHK